MKWFLRLIGRLTKESVTSNSSQGDLDRLYSISRRLERRVTDQAATIAVMKRDLARVDRANYRAAEAEPVVEEPAPQQELDPQRLMEIFNR